VILSTARRSRSEAACSASSRARSAFAPKSLPRDLSKRQSTRHERNSARRNGGNQRMRETIRKCSRPGREAARVLLCGRRWRRVGAQRCASAGVTGACHTEAPPRSIWNRGLEPLGCQAPPRCRQRARQCARVRKRKPVASTRRTVMHGHVPSLPHSSRTVTPLPFARSGRIPLDDGPLAPGAKTSASGPRTHLPAEPPSRWLKDIREYNAGGTAIVPYLTEDPSQLPAVATTAPAPPAVLTHASSPHRVHGPQTFASSSKAPANHPVYYRPDHHTWHLVFLVRFVRWPRTRLPGEPPEGVQGPLPMRQRVEVGRCHGETVSPRS
jgi:hypothetical protein